MNNIHAEVDEILRTGNKKAIISLFLSMHGNYIRATEAEAKLAKAQAEIEQLKEKIKGCQSCKHRLPENEMVEVCLNEAKCCRTTSWRVIDRTTSAQRESWPDLWEEKL